MAQPSARSDPDRDCWLRTSFSDGFPEGRQAMISQEPVGRMGQQDEIASAVLWLCSDAASFVTGHTVVVDGGQTV
jgi:NAD(P)-dependent dehydrogenase (short-subunit alcohol dehydrogenase family)